MHRNPDLAARVAVVASLLLPAVARAQSSPPPALDGVALATGDAAAIRGRARVGIEPVDVALFIPRVVLFPVHLVTEFVLRRPLVALSAGIESTGLDRWTRAVFQPHRDISWAPAFDLVLGFTPLFGANATVNNIGFHGHDLSVRALGGADATDLAFQDRVQLGPVRLGIRATHYERPDAVFYGIGPTSEGPSRHNDERKPRYHILRTDASVFGELRATYHFRLNLSGTFRRDLTGAAEHDSVTQFLTPDQLPGLGALTLFLGRGELAIDTRSNVLQRTGFRLDITGLAGSSVVADEDVHFVVGTALAEVAVEVAHPGRVLVFGAYVADSSALGHEPIPFTYLPSLGGTQHVGFVPGRFTGPSAVLAEIRYRFPIWVHLDGVWVVSVGNVFGQHFAGFDAREMTGSAGFGVRTRFPGLDALEAIIAVGSNRFDQDFGIQSFRVALNLNRGL